MIKRYLLLTTLVWSSCIFSMTKSVLIPQPFAEVSKTLRHTVFNESGMQHFTWSDISQPLMEMDRRWLLGLFYYNPPLSSGLNGNVSAEQRMLLTQGVTAGVLTQKEYDRYAHYLIDTDKYSPANLQRVHLLTQKIPQQTFERKKGDIYQYGFIMDMSVLLNKPNMTLFFYYSQTEKAISEFNLFSCMTGVVCIFSPHVTTSTMPPEPYIDRTLADNVTQFLTKNHALAEKQTNDYMRVFYADSQQKSDIADASTTVEGIPETSLETYDLPVSDSDNRFSYIKPLKGILTLSDGGVLVALDDNTRVYHIHDGKLQKLAVPFIFDSVEIDTKGNLWGFGYYNSGVDFVKWTPLTQKMTTMRYSAENIIAPDKWLITGKNDIFLMQDGALQKLSMKENKFINTDVYWNWRLRTDIDNLLENTTARWNSSSEVKFNDGLFWYSRRDVYGVSPTTGKVVAAIPTSEAVFFGSHEGNWAIASGDFDDSGRYYVNRVDLTSGEAMSRMRTGVTIPDKNRQPCLKLARTAQGRLLALAGENYITLWDMKTTQPIARLAITQGYNLTGMAFTWQGDKLWLYMKSKDNLRSAKLAQWQVPAAYRDRVSARALPDQMFCLADE
jgi:hypothetical protein